MFRVGADPEAFLRDANQNYISSVGLIGGTKWNPLQLGEGFAIQEDNVAVEFNIPPAETAAKFVESINLGLAHLQAAVRGHGLVLSFDPSVSFPEDQLQTYEAQTFGCDPDFNAWTKRRNPRPKAKDKNLRSCGGHVHIESGADPWLLGRWMDVFCGVPMVLIDEDTRRRELYGRAGAIRIKNYPGIEYRTLSNKWLESDNLKAWVWHNTRDAETAAAASEKISMKDGAMIREAINSSHKELAQELITKFQVTIP